MIKYFILLTLFLSTSSYAEDPLHIILENHNNKLRFYLINISDKGVLVNKRFSLGNGPPKEIILDIENSEGRKFVYMSMSDSFVLEEKDLFLLGSKGIIGKELRNSHLIRDYSLIPGRYRARIIYKHAPANAEYFADKGVYSGQLISNWVTFELTETDINNSKDYFKRLRERARKRWKENEII